MVNLTQVIQNLPLIIDILLKIALLSIAIFFGKIAISGWKNKLDFFTKTVGVIVIGFICFLVGVLLPFQIFPEITFISELINSLIIAMLIYAILTLLSTKVKSKTNIPFIVGSALAVAMLITVFFLMTPENIARVSDKFSFYGFKMEEGECLDVEVLIEKWNNNEGRLEEYNYNMIEITSSVKNYIGEDLEISPFLYDLPLIVDSGIVYGAFFATEEKIDSTPVALSTLQASIISGSNYICSVNLKNNEVCSCNGFDEPKTVAQVTTFLNNIQESQ